MEVAIERLVVGALLAALLLAAAADAQTVRVTTFAELARALRSGALDVVVVAADFTATSTLTVSAGATVTVRGDVVNDASNRRSIAGAVNFTGTLFDIPRSAALTLQDLEVTSMDTSKDEAAVVNAGELTLTRCTFSLNTFRGKAGASGAAALYNKGTATLTSCTFSSNVITRSTVAGTINNEGSLTVTACTFRGNEGFRGSALHSSGELDIINSSFRGNTAENCGAAVFVLSGGSATITNSSLVGNKGLAQGSNVLPGGVVSVAGKGSTLTLDDCQFLDNLPCNDTICDHSGAYGGCLGVSNAAEATVHRTDFIGCSTSDAGNGGGAFYNDGGVVTLADSNFLDNTADAHAAVGYNNAGSVTLQRCNIDNPYANTEGGAFYNRADMSILNSNITGSQSSDGGVFINFGTLLLSNCTLTSNGLYNTDSGFGGVAINYNVFQAVRSRFIGSRAYQAGVLYNAVNSVSAAFTNCTFLNNTATQASGGVYFGEVNAGVATFEGCVFDGNSAGGDGGSLLGQTSLTITSSNFTRNSAKRSGGAVYNIATASISDCRFSENSAVIGGGAVHNVRVMTIIGSVFERNRAEAFCGDVRNSVAQELVLNNRVLLRGGVSGNSLRITNCVFQNSSAKGQGGSICNSLGNLTLTDSLIMGARADTGGGVFVGGADSAANCQQMSTVIQGSTLSSNVATTLGGGLAVDPSQCKFAGQVDVTNTTFANNTAQSGGGVSSGCGDAATCPTLTNVTFTNNTAAGGGGGALYSTSSLPNIVRCPDNLVPSQGCTAWRGNIATKGGYGNVVATSPRLLQASQSNYSGVASASALADLRIRVLDEYGQLISGGPNASLALQAVLLSGVSASRARIVGQPVSVTIGKEETECMLHVCGIASYSGLAVRSVPGVSAVDITARKLPPTRIFVDVRSCVPGESTSPDGDLCTYCQAPSYSFDPTTVGCLSCPVDTADCYGGAQVVAQQGYWQSGLLVDQFVQCLSQIACSQDNRTEILKAKVQNGTWTANDQCEQGYEGNLCAVCSTGYGLSGQIGSYQCKSCGKKSLTALALVGLALISMAAIILIIRSASDLPFDAIDEERMTLGMMIPAIVKLLVSYLQVNSIAFGVQFRWPAFIKRVLGVVSSASTVGVQLLSPHCLLGDGQRLDKSFQVLIAFVALPFIAAALPALFYTARWYYLKARKRLVLHSTSSPHDDGFAEYLKPRYALATFVTQFFLWPSVTTRIVALFSCRNVNAAGPNVPASAVGTFWEQAMNHQCYKGTHMIMVGVIGIPGVIIFCIGVPLFTFIILYRKRKFLFMEATAKYYGFLYAGYRRKMYYWECIVCLQKLALIFVLVFLSQLGTDKQILISLGLACIFTLMSRVAAPYASDKLCNMQTIAWASNCVLLYVGWLFFLPLSSGLRLLLSIVFGGIYIGSILLFLALLSTEIITGFKQLQRRSSRRDHDIQKDDVADALREALGPALGTILVTLHSAYTLFKRRTRRYIRKRRLGAAQQHHREYQQRDFQPHDKNAVVSQTQGAGIDVTLSATPAASNRDMKLDSPFGSARALPTNVAGDNAVHEIGEAGIVTQEQAHDGTAEKTDWVDDEESTFDSKRQE
eukprot:jgi/Chlat1/8544/Chrsp82S07944